MTVDWQTAVNDRGRLAAVDRAGSIWLGPEDAFDRLAELAVELIGVDRACVTLVDAQHTTAKSILGFPEGSPRAAPIAQSFCRFVVGSGRPLIVDDAARDPRTRGDAAIKLFQAASWAGYPIEDADGVILGTFCLMDTNPHEWTPRDISIIATLARAASSEIALRIAQAEAVAAREQLELLRLTTRHDHDALHAHLEELASLGAPTDRFATDLSAWLDKRRKPIP